MISAAYGQCATCGRSLTMGHVCIKASVNDVNKQTTEFIFMAIEANERTKGSKLHFGSQEGPDA